MYKYSVSFTDQQHSFTRDIILTSSQKNAGGKATVSVNGSGQVDADNMKEARINASEKFPDKTIKNILKDEQAGAFYA